MQTDKNKFNTFLQSRVKTYIRENKASNRNKYVQTEEEITAEEEERQRQLLAQYGHRLHSSGDVNGASISGNLGQTNFGFNAQVTNPKISFVNSFHTSSLKLQNESSKDKGNDMASNVDLMHERTNDKLKTKAQYPLAVSKISTQRILKKSSKTSFLKIEKMSHSMESLNDDMIHLQVENKSKNKNRSSMVNNRSKGKIHVRKFS